MEFLSIIRGKFTYLRSNLIISKKLKVSQNYKATKLLITRLKVVYTREGGRSAAYKPCRLKFFVRCTTRHLKEYFLKVSD